MSHELYDGNQLPENPTSNLQLLVSLMYTLMMTLYMSLGGFAAWATQKRLILSPCDSGGAESKCSSPVGHLQHPTNYMSDLIRKRNAVCGGLLSFIPAVYSLVHLYTSSLHSSNLYSAGDVILAALLGYSAFFLGQTLQTLVAELDRMDTTKAVYESLYMLASAYDRLERCKPKQTPRDRAEQAPDSKSEVHTDIFHKVNAAQPEDDTKQLHAAWRHPWVLFNVFLAIAVQDDAQIWCMFTAWLRTFRESALTVWVPRYPSFWYEIWDWLKPAWFEALMQTWAACPSRGIRTQKERPSARHPPWLTNVAYGYWLYSRSDSIRTITGSLVLHQGIHDELQLASYRSQQLYAAAAAYIDTLTYHVKEIMEVSLQWQREEKSSVTFYTETGEKLPYRELVACCQHIFHPNQAQALGMVCERYICRLTPAFASLCLSTNTLVPRLLGCWKKLFIKGPARDLLSKDGGYWCHLWLAYMHVVLLAVDLLRMHNNKPYFKDAICEAGALNILAAASDAKRPEGVVFQGPMTYYQDSRLKEAKTAAAAVSDLSKSDKLQGDGDIKYATLHYMSDADLYALAAYVATLLLKVMKMQVEGCAPGAAKEPGVAKQGPAAAEQLPGAATQEPAAAKQKPDAKLQTYRLGLVDPGKVKLSNCGIEAFRGRLLEAKQEPVPYGDYLLSRSQLISSHISLPAIVRGKGPHVATEQAAELLAASVVVAAVADQAVNAAQEVCAVDLDYTLLERHVHDWKVKVTEIERAVGQPGNKREQGGCATDVLESTIEVEDAAVADAAACWHKELAGNAAQSTNSSGLGQGRPCLHAAAKTGGLGKSKQQDSDKSKQQLDSCWSKLAAIRFESILLMLQLSLHRISLSSCLEKSRRHFYRNRFNLWHVMIKAVVPLFFYAFIVSIILVIWQEPWYAGPGMCYSRCYNLSDCQAQQTLGLVGADNSLGRWATVREALAGMHNKAPACPGAGALVIPATSDDNSCGCPWLAQDFIVTVLQPVPHAVSDNSTLCTAQVRLVESSTGLPPSIGTELPAVWHSMTNGENDDASPQAEDRIVGLTNSTGYANLTTPLGKPFNSSSGHGCNVTVLASEVASFVINQQGSVLHNHIGWGCIDCKGEWLTVSKCDAMCDSDGNETKTHHIVVPHNDCGATCRYPEGQNMTELCHNYTFCGCTGDWLESKACDARCESWGKRTMTYHIYKPAMARWVDGVLVPGAPCPAQDLQTREEDCVNNAKCVVPLHADVYSQSGTGVHADLVAGKLVLCVPLSGVKDMQAFIITALDSKRVANRVWTS
eukprot:gene4295-4547_t